MKSDENKNGSEIRFRANSKTLNSKNVETGSDSKVNNIQERHRTDNNKKKSVFNLYKIFDNRNSLFTIGIVLIVILIIIFIMLGFHKKSKTDIVDGASVSEEQTAEKGLYDSEINSAELLASQYNYDEAIEKLQDLNEDIKDDNSSNSKSVTNLIKEYQKQKNSLVATSYEKVTHVFFHSLIVDDSKAFDGDATQDGYNQVMTTITEFNSIIQQMYDRGYVMVSMHDMCTVNADGSVEMHDIYLPEGKIPFVLSQDDVSYYHYMDGDGFPQKLVVDENGDVKNSYMQDDGTISIGDYDMVPLIDTFVKEHPDFAYHGHKGVIALTGYEGVLGYRTDEVYKTRDSERLTEYQKIFLNENPDFDYEKDVKDAKSVATAMKDNGWEFASHTWGHIDPQKYGYYATAQDAKRWDDNVRSIVGNTDIMIFAFGADIGDWHPYDDTNELFKLYKSYGFHIFCNVDSQKYSVQVGSDYMRMGRRNLDGYRMYYFPEKLDDLFETSKAWDNNRPTPVKSMS